MICFLVSLPQLLLCFLGTSLPPLNGFKVCFQSHKHFRGIFLVVPEISLLTDAENQVGRSVWISQSWVKMFSSLSLVIPVTDWALIRERKWLLISHVKTVFGSSASAISRLQMMEWAPSSSQACLHGFFFFRMDIVHELYLSLVSTRTSKHWQQPVPNYHCHVAKIRLGIPELSTVHIPAFQSNFTWPTVFHSKSWELSCVCQVGEMDSRAWAECACSSLWN